MPEWIGPVSVAILTALAVGSTIFFIGRWVGTINSRDSAFSELMESIGSDVESIKDIAVKASSGLARSGSPLQLTEDGENVANAIGAKEWAKELARGSLKSFRGLEAFEIDDHARKYVDRDRSERVQKMIAMARYQFGLDEASIRSALAIVLRDALLGPD